MWAVGVLTDLGDMMLCQKSLYESCRMGRRIVVMKLICSLRHCECDGHTVHKLSQRHLTADQLAPRESDYSRMRNKDSSDRLPSYIKATRPVLEIFRMAGYFRAALVYIHIHSLVFGLRGRAGRNQSPVMLPVWLWHTAS